MRNKSILFPVFSLVVALCLAAPILTSAQTSNVRPRITAAIDETKVTRLQGNTHPLARPEFDRGAAPLSLPMRRMLLVLKRSPEQEAALGALLEQQQDKSSPNFHNWLTPDQFGQQFGPADQDIQTVASWLQSHGFEVARVSRGRGVIEFSGTARQVQEAFHTEIHKFTVNGEDHWANARDPQIPEALAPVVVGVNTLHNFPRRQMHEVMGAFSRTKATGTVKPSGAQFTFPNPCNPTAQPFCNFAIGPADFAKIYDVPNLLLNPVPTTQFNGDGITIAVVAESNINAKDMSDFRTLFGLPAPKLNVIVDGVDPGLLPGAETEADLDVQWAGAVAPNATIDLVVSQSTETSLGADLSAQYAVDNNLAPILNESFGLCEFFIGTTGNAFYNQLWQQAAAQGITVTVSSGDSGSAGCNRGAGPASFGLAVSGFTSTPYNVSVGGTDFNDINNFSAFWNTTSGDTPTVASAKGYIPEMTWNDTCTNQEIFSFFGTTTAEQTCNNATVQQDGLVGVAGGSGGKSSCTVSDGQNESSCSGGYPKPSWQTALTPADGKRDIPDVSLFASNGFNSSFYLICEADLSPGATSCDPFAPASDFVGIGGTSASSPAFAGIVALVNQATGSRQGNANYILYQLAAQSGASCASAASPASSCVFYDMPSGSTIAMPCAKNSSNCTVSNSSDSIGVLSGYATTSGYDLATGLGSVNAANLVNKWKTFALSLKPSSTSLALNGGSPVNITHGRSVNLSISTTPMAPATGTPTGNVSVIANTGPSGQEGVQSFTLTSGSVSSTTNALPGGTYTVVAQYPGDGTFGGSNSTPPISVTVAPETSKTQLAYELFDPTTGIQTNPNATTAAYGSFSLLRMNVTSQAGDACSNNAPGDTGCPTGNVALTDNGNPLDGGTFLLNSEGYAEDQIVQFGVGTHVLNAAYSGDASFNPNSATPVTLTISKAATSVGLGGATAAGFGTFAPFTAIISTQSTGAAPSGSVQFFVGGSAVGSPVTVAGTASSAAGFASASATLDISGFLKAGSNSITAQYSGDGNYSQSPISPAASIKVLATTTTAVTTGAGATVWQGQSVTFTATVTPNQSGDPAPTGSVQFFANGTSIGTGSLSSGQAQVTTSALPTGTVQITAQYAGDSNNVSSTSAPVTETVNVAFTIAANPTTINISAPGQPGSTTLTFTSQNGFTGSGSLALSTCGIAPSEEASCSLAAFTLPANGSVQAMLSFSTTAPSAVSPMARNRPTPLGWKTTGVATALACLFCLGIAAFDRRGRKRRWGVALAAAAFAIIAISAGCGGGGSGGGGGGNPGTPAGNLGVNVSITINGVTQTVPGLTVNVQ